MGLQTGSTLALAHFSSHGLGLQNSAYGAEASRDKHKNKFPCLAKCRKYTECLFEQLHDFQKRRGAQRVTLLS